MQAGVGRLAQELARCKLRQPRRDPISHPPRDSGAKPPRRGPPNRPRRSVLRRSPAIARPRASTAAATNFTNVGGHGERSRGFPAPRPLRKSSDPPPEAGNGARLGWSRATIVEARDPHRLRASTGRPQSRRGEVRRTGPRCWCAAPSNQRPFPTRGCRAGNASALSQASSKRRASPEVPRATGPEQRLFGFAGTALEASRAALGSSETRARRRRCGSRQPPRCRASPLLDRGRATQPRPQPLDRGRSHSTDGATTRAWSDSSRKPSHLGLPRRRPLAETAVASSGHGVRPPKGLAPPRASRNAIVVSLEPGQTQGRGHACSEDSRISERLEGPSTRRLVDTSADTRASSTWARGPGPEHSSTRGHERRHPSLVDSWARGPEPEHRATVDSWTKPQHEPHRREDSWMRWTRGPEPSTREPRLKDPTTGGTMVSSTRGPRPSGKPVTRDTTTGGRDHPGTTDPEDPRLADRGPRGPGTRRPAHPSTVGERAAWRRRRAVSSRSRRSHSPRGRTRDLIGAGEWRLSAPRQPREAPRQPREAPRQPREAPRQPRECLRGQPTPGLLERQKRPGRAPPQRRRPRPLACCRQPRARDRAFAPRTSGPRGRAGTESESSAADFARTPAVAARSRHESFCE